MYDDVCMLTSLSISVSVAMYNLLMELMMALKKYAAKNVFCIKLVAKTTMLNPLRKSVPVKPVPASC